MRALRVLPVLAVIMVATTIASVFAAGYTVATPLLGTSGAPALSGSQFTGIITVLYADGMPVVLAANKANLQLCASSCIVEPVTLKQTAPGTYAYSFTPPSSLNGTITIAVLAGGLADDNGRIFPSVNTQIGTYATPGLASAPANAPSGQALPASPVPQSNNVVGQAVALPQQPTQDSTTVEVVLAVTIILLVAGALLILPSRRR
jgi:hypothetical protein